MARLATLTFTSPWRDTVRLSTVAAVGLALLGVACELRAQDAVWLCGQTLTNRLPSDDAEQRQCRQVNLPNATTVPGTRTRPAAPGQGVAPPMPGRERTGTVQIATDEQRQRDAQARTLLLAEKQRLQAQLLTARRSGDATQVALTEADLASVERELSRLP